MYNLFLNCKEVKRLRCGISRMYILLLQAGPGNLSSRISLAQTRKKMNTGHEISPAGARTPPRAHRRPSLFSINSGYMLGYSFD
jgi:hypothetical protein